MKNLIWKIAEAISREARLLGGYSKLARRIKETATEPPCRPVDRRKLKAIVDGKELTISTGELAAIDAYFAPRGEGLADQPLFDRQSLLEDMAENEKCVALVGVFQRNEEERNDVSLWDVQASQELLEGMNKFREVIQSTFHDIPFFNDDGKHSKKVQPVVQVMSKTNLSICSIGSVRSNVGTELVLGEMFQVRPFEHASRRVPFKFFWQEDPKRKEAGFRSAFEATDEDLEEVDSSLMRAVKQGYHACGLLVEDMFLPVIPRENGTWYDYGIVAAQRQPGDRIRIATAGLTGPSTFASARACRMHISMSLPPCPKRGKPKVVWAVVRATISPGASGVGDRRTVGRIDLIKEPRIWPNPR